MEVVRVLVSKCECWKLQVSWKVRMGLLEETSLSEVASVGRYEYPEKCDSGFKSSGESNFQNTPSLADPSAFILLHMYTHIYVWVSIYLVLPRFFRSCMGAVSSDIDT